MSRRGRIRTGLDRGIPRVVAVVGLVARADVAGEHALVGGGGLGGRVGGDDGVGRDGGVGGGQAVQAVSLLELVLADALLALCLCLLCAVGVD
jgi:hypothetical protein